MRGSRSKPISPESKSCIIVFIERNGTDRLMPSQDLLFQRFYGRAQGINEWRIGGAVKRSPNEIHELKRIEFIKKKWVKVKIMRPDFVQSDKDLRRDDA